MSGYATTDTDLFASAGVLEAERQRDRAYALLDASDYADETTRVLRTIVEAGIRKPFGFSANDTRGSLAGVASPRIGRCFALAQQLRLIEFVGYVKSTDKGTHAKRIGEYRWTST